MRTWFRTFTYNLNRHTYIYIGILLILFSSCAQIGYLSGGPKDTQAPRLLKSSPADSAVNVAAGVFYFEFDEFVVLKDVSQLMIWQSLNLAEYNQLTDLFSRNSICGIDPSQGLFSCLCDEEKYLRYPDIEIQIGNNLYTMPRRSYI